jgi:hypothetical protein
MMQERQQDIVQLGEVIGIGSRWRADVTWLAALPFPTEDKYRSGILDDGTLDKTWTPSDRSIDFRRPSVSDAEFEGELAVGDLVLFTNARVLDFFTWDGEDILIYPGNWLHGVVTEVYLSDNPERRRYEPENFEMPARDRSAYADNAKPGKRWKDLV